MFVSTLNYKYDHKFVSLDDKKALLKSELEKYQEKYANLNYFMSLIQELQFLITSVEEKTCFYSYAQQGCCLL